jgi:hypothetical protein
MPFRRIAVLFALASACSAANLLAQPLGTFRWQLEPFGSVLNLNVTQEGAIYLLNGFEAQCSNPSLPVWGVAVPQSNGTVLIGLTTITSNGNGLHTRASIAMSTFGGSWVDNANNSGTFLFNPGTTCPGGPRTGPVEPDPRAAMSSPDAGATAATLDALRAEIDALQKHVMALEAKKP